MNLIEYCEDLSLGFKDKERAFFRLDSIAYIGYNYGVRERGLKNHLNSISKIAKLYGSQEIYILSRVDEIYAESIKNKSSVLWKDIRVNANTFSIILGRLKKYGMEYNRLIDVDDLVLVFKQEISRNGGFKNTRKEEKGIRRYRVYHHKIKS